MPLILSCSSPFSQRAASAHSSSQIYVPRFPLIPLDPSSIFERQFKWGPTRLPTQLQSASVGRLQILSGSALLLSLDLFSLHLQLISLILLPPFSLLPLSLRNASLPTSPMSPSLCSQGSPLPFSPPLSLHSVCHNFSSSGCHGEWDIAGLSSTPGRWS